MRPGLESTIHYLHVWKWFIAFNLLATLNNRAVYFIIVVSIPPMASMLIFVCVYLFGCFGRGGFWQPFASTCSFGHWAQEVGFVEIKRLTRQRQEGAGDRLLLLLLLLLPLWLLWQLQLHRRGWGSRRRRNLWFVDASGERSGPPISGRRWNGTGGSRSCRD